MWIQMVSNISGLRNQQPWPAYGTTLEVSDGEGADLVSSGHAVETEEP